MVSLFSCEKKFSRELNELLLTSSLIMGGLHGNITI